MVRKIEKKRLFFLIDKVCAVGMVHTSGRPFQHRVAGNARRPVGGVGPADKTVAVQSAAQRILGA